MPDLSKWAKETPRNAAGRWESAGGDKRPLSTDRWGNFKDLSGMQREWMLDLKRRQAEYESNPKNPRGIRVDHADGLSPLDDETIDRMLKFGGFANWVAENGDEHELPGEPPDILLGEPKNCFENATEMVVNEPGKYLYAEGLVFSPRWPMGVHHAWVVEKKTGHVVDPTLGWDPASRYIGITMQKSELAKHLLKNRVYGVLMPRGLPGDLLMGPRKVAK